jgi:hypothetical protein
MNTILTQAVVESLESTRKEGLKQSDALLGVFYNVT